MQMKALTYLILMPYLVRRSFRGKEKKKEKHNKMGTLNYPETKQKKNQSADHINRNKSKIIEHFCRRIPKFGIDKTEQI